MTDATDHSPPIPMPMHGIRVIELASWVLGPAAATLLADWGADVVKIEPPASGDPMRDVISPVRLGDDSRLVNFLVEQYARNKRSLALDITDPDGRAVLDRLLEGADVFLTNQLPDACATLGLTPDDVRRINPNLVYARATGQGTRGPDAARPAYDMVSYWCRGGIADLLTVDGNPPVGARAAIGDGPSGTFLAGGIAMALFHRERTGEALDVDVSLLGAATWTVASDMVGALQLGFPLPTTPVVDAPFPLQAYYRTADGRWVILNMFQDERYWPAVARALDIEWIFSDERFDTAEKRKENAAGIKQVLVDAIGSRTLADLRPRLDAEPTVVWSSVQTLMEVAADPQTTANGHLQTTVDSGGEEVTVVSNPVQIAGRPAPVRSGAPAIGQHTHEVLRELGYADGEIEKLRAEGIIRTAERRS